MTYQSAIAQLTGRNSEGRKIANNTYLERRGEDIAIRLHSTDIILLKPNGDTVLDTGGWLTVTTKARMNDYLPAFRLWSDRGIWYLNRSADEQWPYADGMTIHADGTVSGQGEDPKAKLKLKRKVASFCQHYMEALAAGKVEQPGAGDCFYCQMREVETKRPLGEVFKDADHILEHMKEQYFVPSLMSRAIEVFPVSQAAKWYLGSFWDNQADNETRSSARSAGEMCKDQLHKALRRYVTRQLGMAA